MEKNCSCPDNQSCQYACLVGLYIFCKYAGYCEYQLPKTSKYFEPINDIKCTCGTSNCVCPVHGMNGKL